MLGHFYKRGDIFIKKSRIVLENGKTILYNTRRKIFLKRTAKI